MNSSLGYIAFRLGFFIFFVSGVLLLFLERGTAEQALMLFTFLIALCFLLALALVIRLSQRGP